jgi:hypothetical protein
MIESRRDSAQSSGLFEGPLQFSSLNLCYLEDVLNTAVLLNNNAYVNVRSTVVSGYIMDRSLVEFYRKFKQQIDPPNVPSGAVLKNPDVQLVLERHFFNVAAEDLSAYQAKILRTVVERIQNAITDPEDEVRSIHAGSILAQVSTRV